MCTIGIKNKKKKKGIIEKRMEAGEALLKQQDQWCGSRGRDTSKRSNGKEEHGECERGGSRRCHDRRDD